MGSPSPSERVRERENMRQDEERRNESSESVHTPKVLYMNTWKHVEHMQISQEPRERGRF